MSIHVLRHGQTDANAYNEVSGAENRLFGQSEAALTPRGIRQMRDLGVLYAERRIVFARVLSSPADRATTSADALQDGMGRRVPVEKIAGLSERSSGIIAGKTREQLLAEHPALEEHFRRDPELRHIRESFEPSGIPGFEDYAAVTERMKKDVIPLLLEADGAESDQAYELIALDDDVGDYPRVAALTHKHALRCLLHAVLRLTREQTVALAVPNAQPFVLRRKR
jgi:broad specificity phosphatase PhoE